MRIVVANKYYYRNGGSEVVLFQERDFLKAHNHEVFDFSMADERNIASQYSSYFTVSHNYRVNTGTLTKAKSAFSLIHSFDASKSISKLIADTRPDVVHCHNIYHQLTPSIIGAAKRMGVPVVLTLHDYKPVCPTYNRLRQGQPCSYCLDGDFSGVLKYWCSEGSFGKSALLYAEAVIQRWLGNYEKVDAFIAPSRFMAEAISHRVSTDRIRLLYNGVDSDAIKPNESDDGYVLYLGRLSVEKGVETLLRAHDSSKSDWSLMVAGTGPLEQALRDRYLKAKFIGHVSGEALQATISRAAVVVVPSEWYENCPMSVLEAMAYGKPVVASRMGGIPELVADGVTGVLFESGDADALGGQLERLMNDPTLRRQMGHAARQRVVSEFSLDKHNQSLLEIYRDVC